MSFISGDYEYDITSETTCTVIGFPGPAVAAVSIPARATDSSTGIEYDVTAINNFAFQLETTITSVTLAPGLIIIGNGAFARCSGLISALVIPNTVTSIGSQAFVLTKITSLTITDIGPGTFTPAKALTIGNSAFSSITTLTDGQLTIPRQVTSIGAQAFQNSNLTGLTFTADSNCATIGATAFFVDPAASTLIGALVIPNTVTSIGNQAFQGTKITSLTITDIGPGTFTPAKALTISNNAFRNIKTLTGPGTTITIPRQVVSIGANAFEQTNLTELTFTADSNCTTIGTLAFTDAVVGNIPTLKGALTIPNTVTSIGNSAFAFTQITSLTIEDITGDFTLAKALTIGITAFVGIVTLTSTTITIPRQVVTINNSAFQNTNLTSLIFKAGSNCKTIGGRAFRSTLGAVSTLIGPLVIPSTVTLIGTEAFVSTRITSLTIEDITGDFTPAKALTIGVSAFSGIATLTSTTITIPRHVVTINNRAFQNTNLTSLAFTADSNCTIIGDHAFTVAVGGTSALVGALTIPSTVTSIGLEAFAFTQITSLTIEDITGDFTPAKALTIGRAAFSAITTLTTSLTIPRQVTVIDNIAFKESTLTGLVFTGVSNCTTIVESAFTSCSNLVGTLTIPPSLTSIGFQAFVGTGLVTLTLPTLTQALLIGQEAFLDVASLRLPNPFSIPALVTVGVDAFKGTGLVFASGTTFASDNNLYLITSTAPPTCTLIGFAGASTETLTVPATATSGGQAYTVTAIAANAYKDNAVITTLLISAQSKLVKIGANTFQGALNLTSPNPLTFPATIQFIGANAFTGTGLTIIYPADMQQLTNEARSRTAVVGRIGPP